MENLYSIEHVQVSSRYVGDFILLTFIEPFRLALNELAEIQYCLLACRTCLCTSNAVAFSNIHQCEYHVDGMVRNWGIF